MHEKVGSQKAMLDHAVEKSGGQVNPWPCASAVYVPSKIWHQCKLPMLVKIFIKKLMKFLEILEIFKCWLFEIAFEIFAAAYKCHNNQITQQSN